MSNKLEEGTKLIGHITVTEIVEQPDGSLQVIFDYDEAFKKEYKRIFNLKRWSKKHFEQHLDIAIKNLAKQVETEEGFAALREQIIAMKED